MADLHEVLSSTGTEPVSLSITSKPNKLLAAKLNKILSSAGNDDLRVKAALTALSDIHGLDDLELKRNLRGTIEKKEIEANKKFLEGFSKVIEQLSNIEEEMELINEACKEMKEKLRLAGAETAQMIEQAKNIQDRRSACETRCLIVDRFLEKFTLSEDEIRILSSPTVSIDDNFFEALDHLQRIHSDCKLLLVTKNQQAGLQIMESMALYQETAYEKLYRWTQHESRASFGGDSIEVSSLMSKALQALMHRPVLFQTILDEIAVARREAVGHAFLNALTRGGPGGTPRPIELQAHDSLRYIGDMLAWIHQACASEKEMLESVFQKPAKSRFIDDAEESNGLAGSFKIKDAIDDLLDCVVEGTSRPLKSRMEQVLVLQPGAITSYRVANLIQFYAGTIGKLLRKNASFSKVLFDITDMAYKYFFKTLDAQAEKLLQSAEPPHADLNVSPIVRDMALQLKEILSSYNSSLTGDSADTEDMPTFNINETMDAIIDPLIQMCEMSVQKFNDMDRQIYLINCIQHIQSVIVPYSFARTKRDGLQKRMDELVHSLASEKHHKLLAESGLSKIHEALANKEADTPLSTVPNMDAASISLAMSHFDSFLLMASADVSPQLQRLASSQIYQQIQDEAIRLLLDTYRHIYTEVRDPKNQYEHPEELLPRTVEEMEAIFSFAL